MNFLLMSNAVMLTLMGPNGKTECDYSIIGFINSLDSTNTLPCLHLSFHFNCTLICFPWETNRCDKLCQVICCNRCKELEACCEPSNTFGGQSHTV